MAFFASIKDGIVDNCIVADSLAIAEEITGLVCVEYEEDVKPHIGYAYADGIFEAPVVVLEESAPLDAPVEVTPAE
jgi:hypothetical protein